MCCSLRCGVSVRRVRSTFLPCSDRRLKCLLGNKQHHAASPWRRVLQLLFFFLFWVFLFKGASHCATLWQARRRRPGALPMLPCCRVAVYWLLLLLLHLLFHFSFFSGICGCHTFGTSVGPADRRPFSVLTVRFDVSFSFIFLCRVLTMD